MRGRARDAAMGIDRVADRAYPTYTGSSARRTSHRQDLHAVARAEGTIETQHPPCDFCRGRSLYLAAGRHGRRRTAPEQSCVNAPAFRASTRPPDPAAGIRHPRAKGDPVPAQPIPIRSAGAFLATAVSAAQYCSLITRLAQLLMESTNQDIGCCQRLMHGAQIKSSSRKGSASRVRRATVRGAMPRRVVASRWPNGFVCPECAVQHCLVPLDLYYCRGR